MCRTQDKVMVMIITRFPCMVIVSIIKLRTKENWFQHLNILQFHISKRWWLAASGAIWVFPWGEFSWGVSLWSEVAMEEYHQCNFNIFLIICQWRTTISLTLTFLSLSSSALSLSSPSAVSFNGESVKKVMILLHFYFSGRLYW